MHALSKLKKYMIKIRPIDREREKKMKVSRGKLIPHSFSASCAEKVLNVS